MIRNGKMQDQSFYRSIEDLVSEEDYVLLGKLRQIYQRKRKKNVQRKTVSTIRKDTSKSISGRGSTKGAFTKDSTKSTSANVSSSGHLTKDRSKEKVTSRNVSAKDVLAKDSSQNVSAKDVLTKSNSQSLSGKDSEETVMYNPPVSFTITVPRKTSLPQFTTHSKYQIEYRGKEQDNFPFKDKANKRTHKGKKAYFERGRDIPIIDFSRDVLLDKDRCLILKSSSEDNNCLFVSLCHWLNSKDKDLFIDDLSTKLRPFYEKYAIEPNDSFVVTKTDQEEGREIFLKERMNDLLAKHGSTLWEFFIKLRGENPLKTDIEDRANSVLKGLSVDARGGIEHIILYSLLSRSPVLVWEHYSENLFSLRYHTLEEMQLLPDDHKLWKELQSFTIKNNTDSVIHLLFHPRDIDALAHYESLVVFDDTK